MKLTIAIAIFATVAGILVFCGCRKKGVQADVDAAVAQGNYQFVALLDKKGKWTYPQVPEIPDWYFQTTGIAIRTTTAETFDNDYAYMKSYNDALYQTLKAQGKFQAIQENVAKVKANLDKYKAATQNQGSTNPAGPKN